MPALFYNLELTELELQHLWTRLALADNFTVEDRQVIEKLERLMEGK